MSRTAWIDLKGGQVAEDAFDAAQTKAKFWQSQPFSGCTEETQSGAAAVPSLGDTEKYFSWMTH